MNLLYFSRIHYDLNVFSRNYYESIFFSQNYYEFTILCANLLSIHFRMFWLNGIFKIDQFKEHFWPKEVEWWNCKTTSENFLWPYLSSNNFKLQSPTKFWVRTYLYLMYFDQSARFDPFLTVLTQVWPLMTLIDLEKYQIWILENILSRNIRILDTFRLIRPIWP